MKKTAKIVFSLLIVVILSLCFCANAFAVQEKNGITVAITSDKTAYAESDTAKLQVSVKNTNTYDISNLTIESIIPKGLKQIGTDPLKMTRNVLAGEEVNFQIGLQKVTSEAEVDAPKTGDESGPVLSAFLLSVSVLGIMLLLFYKHRKGLRNILSVFLCVLLLVPMLAFPGVLAAEEEDFSLSTTESVQFGDNSYDFTIVLSGGEKKAYALTVTAGEGGRVTEVDGNYGKGESIQLKAIPEDGYQFVNWVSSNGGFFQDDTSESTVFTMPDNAVQITANFKASEEVPDAFFAQSDADALQIEFTYPDYEESVTQNVTLPNLGEHGSAITWTTDNSSLISETGVVTQPSQSSAYVTLKALVTYGTKSIEKEFKLKVIKSFQDVSLHDNTMEDLYALNPDGSLEVYQAENTDNRFIDGCYTDYLVESPLEAIHSLNSVKSLLGIRNPDEEFVWVDTVSDGEHINYKLQQMYQGIPVFGMQIAVSTDLTGKTVSLTNGYLQKLAPYMDYSISEEQAEATALGLAGENAQVLERVLCVYALYEQEPVLAWKICVEGVDSDEVYFYGDYFINAYYGSFINFISHINAGAVSASGTDVLNRTRNFTVYQLQGWELLNPLRSLYEMHDSNRNIKTYNAADWNPFTSLPGTLFGSSFNSWSDKAAVSSHANVSQTYDYYKSVLGRISIDNRGMEVVSSVHVGTWFWGLQTYENAYWNGRQLAFGDGGDTFIELSAGLDVVAHEYTHGVVDYTADLIYQNQSGALNEAYADIFGNLVENKNDAEWLIGEDVMRNPSTRRALRNMSNPNEFYQPDAVEGTYYVAPVASPNNSNDQGGVHTNSGIINHAAYLMWRNGISNKQTLAKLWYKSLLKLNPSSDFLDCRVAVVSAAKNMRMSAQEIEIIKKAFDEVNVKNPEIRIVLTWGETPSDLDLHLTGPASGGGRFHVYYNDMQYYENGEKVAELDYDDTSSYGPEVITVHEPIPGIYRLYVHNFTNRHESGSLGLAGSGAVIQVFLGNSAEPMAIFSVPGGGGTVWNVFEIDSTTQEITPINTMSNQSDPDSVGS